MAHPVAQPSSVDDCRGVEAAFSSIHSRYRFATDLTPTDPRTEFRLRTRFWRTDELMVIRTRSTAYNIYLEQYPPLVFVLPITGRIKYARERSSLESSSDSTGLVLSHGGFTQLRGPGNSEHVSLSLLDPSAAERYAPVLEARVDLSTERFYKIGRCAGSFNGLAGLLHCCASELEGPPSVLDRTPEASLTSQLLTIGLLRLAVSDGNDTRTVEPHYLRRAEEYLQANALEGISLVDLCAHVGRGLRALQIAFKKHRGLTPGEYLRNCRLDAARQRLLRDAHGATVSTIAVDCGYDHFGRFSADYRRRFGELPSATRRAAAA